MNIQFLRKHYLLAKKENPAELSLVSGEKGRLTYGELAEVYRDLILLERKRMFEERWENWSAILVGLLGAGLLGWWLYSCLR